MRIIPETRHLRTVVEEKGIPGHFTQWEDYSRRYLRFQAGEQILTAGKETPGFYFLLQGSIRVYALGADGRVRLLTLCREDDEVLLGDVEYLTGSYSPNHVEAVEESVLLLVPYDRERMETDIALYKYISVMLLKKMEQASENATHMIFQPLPRRLAGYLLTTSDNGIFTGRYTDAANYLGCSYRQLMRLISQFYRDGVLLRENGCIWILRPERLEELAGGAELAHE